MQSKVSQNLSVAVKKLAAAGRAVNIWCGVNQPI